MKKLSKKLSILITIFSLCFVSFLYGLSRNSQASSPTTILPISQGGTGANTASEAAANILGTNFDNYDGVLPVAQGGTGAKTGVLASYNLTKRPELQLRYPGWVVTPYWIKVLDTNLHNGEYGSHTLRVFGTGSFSTYKRNIYISLKQLTWDKGNDYNFKLYVRGVYRNCENDPLKIVYIVDEADPENPHVKVYMLRTDWGANTKLEVLNYRSSTNNDIGASRTGITDFTQEYLTKAPENAINLDIYCAVYE
ncbi:MAG: hypothetical protein LBT91_02975 [Bifidobacteriaceae bacterium]|nr:hypothetical protein [Bifidobacteriaceae bacterium]